MAFLSKLVIAASAAFLFINSAAAFSQSTPKPKKLQHVPRTVWDFDGGVFFQTDGEMRQGTCFRLDGRITAPGFFDDLKRIDDDRGTEFRGGKEIATQFPDQLLLLFSVYDFPCPSQLQSIGTRVYLTREMVSTLHLSLYWKRGIEMRPIQDFKELSVTIHRIAPQASALAAELPERLKWSYELSIPSAGVPLTDSLVLVLHTPERRMVARVAARL